MDQQDGAIVGQPDDETSRKGPYGVEEDGPEQTHQQTYTDDDSPTSGTVLPGDEDAVRQVGLEAVGGEGEQETLDANETLDVASGEADAAEKLGDGEEATS